MWAISAEGGEREKGKGKGKRGRGDRFWVFCGLPGGGGVKCKIKGEREGVWGVEKVK